MMLFCCWILLALAQQQRQNVSVSEIMFNGGSYDFVELTNVGATPLSLDGWSLRGGVRFDFTAAHSLAAGGYLVVAKNVSVRACVCVVRCALCVVCMRVRASGAHASRAAQISSLQQLAPTLASNAVAGPFAGGLNGEFDSLRLEQASGETVVKLRYKNGFPWPAPHGGQSIQLVDPQVWFVS